MLHSGHLLGFIVTNDGIYVDPLKIEAIVNLPLPRTILQLQSLQGKENFLRHFIANYVELTKGFMHLLKKGVPFFWDDQDQCSFDALKCALMSTPVLHPPKYNREFILSLATFDSSIGMVLIKNDDDHIEHVIYYLSKVLVGTELCYPYVEKLDFVAAFVVQ